MKEGYLPLYRKYRPQKLEDIVGQAHIKRALTNAISLNKIAHAYLFTGPRGTGKTSTARILAKSLNCINGPTVTPCEECESCKSITKTVPIDVIEIDAASNRSVNDAHEILEKVNYAPVQGKYKIYIIDEVHMLSDAAFNALLKTLEEPPKNVIFILATTESHKVLDTIKSRCQRFDFKRITTKDIVEHLRKITNAENIKITDGALSVIATSSAGGMRDSLALLDQVSIMGATSEITEDDINNLLGRISFDELMNLSTHIINSDGLSAIELLEKIYNDGNEPVQILTNLMSFFKNILIAKTCDKNYTQELTGLSAERSEQLGVLSKNLEKHQIIFLINKIADYIKEIKDTTNQQLWLEVGLIDLANLADNTKLADLEARLSALEQGNPTIPARATVKLKIPVSQPETKPVEEKTTIVEKPTRKEETTTDVVQTPKIIPAAQTNLQDLWIQILQILLKDNLSGLASMKAMTSLIQCNDEAIIVAGKTQTYTDKLNVPEKKQKLVSAIRSVLGESTVPVIIRTRTPEDGQQQKRKPIPQKKQTPPPTIENNDDISIEEQEIINNNIKKTETATVTDTSGLSEQAKWVKELFDGKVIE